MMETNNPSSHSKVQIPNRLFFKIGDVARLLDVKPHVLRYWETEFSGISPKKSDSGQRVYQRSEVETLVLIKELLYHERYSIEGAKKRIKDLRKGGDLSEVRKNLIDQGEKAQIKEIREVIRELNQIVKTPVSELFPI